MLPEISRRAWKQLIFREDKPRGTVFPYGTDSKFTLRLIGLRLAFRFTVSFRPGIGNVANRRRGGIQGLGAYPEAYDDSRKCRSRNTIPSSMTAGVL